MPTLGDYWIDEQGITQVRVSDDISTRGQFLLVIHELCEMFMCEVDGVGLKQIDEFDLGFEDRVDVAPGSEPGDDAMCPYRHQHRRAELVERLLAEFILPWDVYLNQLSKASEHLDELSNSGHFKK